VTFRLARAYGVLQALLGCLGIVVIGLVVQQQTLGVTRQPLPLVWPLTVLHIVVGQLPLPGIMGSLERVGVRGPWVRGVRALIVLVLLTAVPLTYASGNRALVTFFLIVASAGFTAAAVSRTEPWVWSLGPGMVAVGLLFITPWGGPMSRFLENFPVLAGVTLLVLSTCGYVFRGWQPPSRPPATAVRTR
jgi:hypothetical protein